jgi:hypothetical protein
MSEHTTMNFNELSTISPRTDTGLIAVLTTNDPRNVNVARLVANELASNNKDLTDLYIVLAGSGGIIDIRDQCLQEYPNTGFGKAGAVIVDETFSAEYLPEDTYGQLATLARELDIKIVLLTDTLEAVVEQDANLVVRVTAGENDTHSLGVVKNRHGVTGSVEFTQ